MSRPAPIQRAADPSVEASPRPSTSPRMGMPASNRPNTIPPRSRLRASTPLTPMPMAAAKFDRPREKATSSKASTPQSRPRSPRPGRVPARLPGQDPPGCWHDASDSGQAGQGAGLVGVLGEFLELVQDVAVQEPEQSPVDVIGAAGQHQTQKRPASRTGGGPGVGVASKLGEAQKTAGRCEEREGLWLGNTGQTRQKRRTF